jgi:hypothetical protein
MSSTRIQTVACGCNKTSFFKVNYRPFPLPGFHVCTTTSRMLLSYPDLIYLSGSGGTKSPLPHCSAFITMFWFEEDPHGNLYTMPMQSILWVMRFDYRQGLWANHVTLPPSVSSIVLIVSFELTFSSPAFQLGAPWPWRLPAGNSTPTDLSIR